MKILTEVKLLYAFIYQFQLTSVKIQPKPPMENLSDSLPAHLA